MPSDKPLRVGVFVTHPVQYHVPIWRCLAASPSIDLKVHYFSRQGIDNRVDPGFGRSLQWDIDLLSGYKSEFLADMAVDRFDSARITDPQSSLEGKFEVVLLHGYTQAFARQILCHKNKYGYKVVLRGEFSNQVTRDRGPVKKFLRNIYLNWFYSRTDAFAYVGENAHAHLRSYGVNAEKQFFSPYSVDRDLFEQQRQSTGRDAAREELGIPDDRVVFLFSGKMIPRKRPDFMARVAHRLSQDSRFQLIMLGDGPLLDSTRSMLAPLIEKGQVLLPGFVNQSGLAPYFRAADAFVFPSQRDTWGLVANEAMHFGLPCFLSDQVGSGPDLIVPGVTGHILPDDDLDEWCSLLESYLHKRTRLREMGEEALKKIEPYTPKNAAEGIVCAMNYACDLKDQANSN